MSANLDSNLEAGLNPQQRRAVRHGRGPALVIAGAGTGKTTVITRRIGRLIAAGLARPEEILALTFTDKAAREMEERLDQLLPYGVVSTNIMTFHALGEQILRERGLEIGLGPDFVVMPTFAQIVFLQTLLAASAPLKYFRPPHNPYSFVAELLRHFSRLKDENISPRRYSQFAHVLQRQAKAKKDKTAQLEAAKTAELAALYERYTSSARAQGRIDFGDQIQLVLELFAARPNALAAYQKQYRYVLVDEYQDTNVAQNLLVQQLAGRSGNLFVVGDDDQSIYRFRGAAVSNILEFLRVYPNAKQVVLRTNYRSTQPLLDAAYRLIQHNNPDRLEVREGIDKRLLGGGPGEPPQFSLHDNLPAEMAAVAQQIKLLIDEQNVAPKDIAILLRKNNQAALITPQLRRLGIAFTQTQSSSLLEQPEIKLLLHTVNFLNDEQDSAALYGLLQSEPLRVNAHELAAVAARARAAHQPLAEYILAELSPEHELQEQLLRILAFRELMAELGAGELLYKFINDSGLLNTLLARAETDNVAAAQIQNLAEFFSFVKQFELVSTDPNLFNFWHYLSEIRSSAADIFADTSPLDLNAVNITTIHKAKGLEYEAVFMIDLVQNTFPTTRRAEILPLPDKLLPYAVPRDWHTEEERRLFYVGLTRAKRYLYLSASLDHGGARIRRVSRFVAETLPQLPPRQTSTNLGKLELITQYDRQPALPFDPLDMLTVDGWLHVSVNQIADYLRSPREFWFFHILNVPKGPFHSLVYGSAVHAAIEQYYRTLMAGAVPSAANLVAVFDRHWRSEGFISLHHEQELRRQGRKLVRAFVRRQGATPVVPIAVEQPFILSLKEYKVRISGRYDAVFADQLNQGVEIRDFKTGAVDTEAKARARLRASFQLALYALAWDRSHDQADKTVTKTSLNFVEHDILVTNTKIDHAATLATLAKALEGIRAKRFESPGRSQINFDRLL